MTWEQITTEIQTHSIISFKEYALDRHERKKLTVEIDPSPVETVIPPNTPLSKEMLEKYYGTDLPELDYLQLSNSSDIRIVVIIGITEEKQPLYKVLYINKDFYNMGLQVLTVLNNTGFMGGNFYGTYSAPR